MGHSLEVEYGLVVRSVTGSILPGGTTELFLILASALPQVFVWK